MDSSFTRCFVRLITATINKKSVCIYYTHTYICTYMLYTYIYTYIHTYIHTYIYTYLLDVHIV